jgi:hypothetical protein
VADAFALNFGVLLAILVTGIALMLVLVSAVSYARLRTAKLLFAGAAFLVLALKGVLFAWRGIVDREADLFAILLDTAVLGFMYAAVAKR